MEDRLLNLRFYHMGKFQNGQYVGGKETEIMNVESDLFSYPVLMEHVMNDLEYTEIGGVYKRNGNEAGGWKLVANDEDLFDLVKETQNDDHVDFYIDNVVNTKIEPVPQMQPHVVIRPRPNVFEGIKLYV